MALPTTRAELRTYCREKNGEPVIKVNVDDLQIDHAIDDAIDLFQEYHAIGTRTEYIAYQVTAADITNKYIPLDENVLAVKRVLSMNGDAGASFGGDAMFDPVYQLRLNDLWDLSSANLTYYTIARQYLSTIDDSLNTGIRYDYNPYENKLHLHLNWDKYIKEDRFIVAEADLIVDEAMTNGKIYKNRVIRNLSAAYTRKVWARNLSKYQSIQLPGGITLDASTIMQEADEQIEKYEQEIKDSQGPMPIYYG